MHSNQFFCFLQRLKVARLLAALLPASATGSHDDNNKEHESKDESNNDQEEEAETAEMVNVAMAAGCSVELLKALRVVGGACEKEAKRTLEVGELLDICHNCDLNAHCISNECTLSSSFN